MISKHVPNSNFPVINVRCCLAELSKRGLPLSGKHGKNYLVAFDSDITGVIKVGTSSRIS